MKYYAIKEKKAYKCYGVPPFHPTNYDCVFVTMDETYIYCQEFAIPRKGGKNAVTLLRNAGEYWEVNLHFLLIENIFFIWTRSISFIELIKKTRKDVKLSKKNGCQCMPQMKRYI